MIARAVERFDPKGRARAAARSIILRGQRHDDLLPHLCLIEPVDRIALHQPRRQMKQHIDHAFQPEPRQRFGQLRPDTFEVGERGEKRVEDIGSHGDSISPAAHVILFQRSRRSRQAPLPFRPLGHPGPRRNGPCSAGRRSASSHDAIAPRFCRTAKNRDDRQQADFDGRPIPALPGASPFLHSAPSPSGRRRDAAASPPDTPPTSTACRPDSSLCRLLPLRSERPKADRPCP